MSRIDSFISKLMGSDEELKKFLVDPISHAQDENGLSKADRSVIRRVLAGVSHKATNGMALHRSLGSYRRSLRLLQNVLHVHSGTVLANQNAASSASSTGTSYTVMVYFGPYAETPGVMPYSNYLMGSATPSEPNPTIQDVMNAIETWTLGDGSAATLSYIPNEHNSIVTFVINGTSYTALPGDPSTSRNPFWFYSVNGQALNPASYYQTINPDAYYGSDGYSFEDYTLENDGNGVIYWQCIAPDVRYGFQPCEQQGA